MNNFSSCDKVKSLLSAFFDGELSKEENNIVINHLKLCTCCKSELKNIQKLSSLIKKSCINEFKELIPDNILYCLEVRKDLKLLLDKELEKDRMLNCLEHVLNCYSCKKHYESLKNFNQTIKTYFLKYLEKVEFHQDNLFYLFDNKKDKIAKKVKITAVYGTAAILLAGSAWFLICNSNKPKEVEVDYTKFTKSDKPLYVNVDEYFYSSDKPICLSDEDLCIK